MILEGFAREAKELHKTIVFAEGDEERTVEAAGMLVKDGICKVKLIAPDNAVVEKIASAKKIDISQIEVIKPSEDLLDKTVLDGFIASRVNKGIIEADAHKLVLEQLYFGALYIKSGLADGGVAGARSSTSDVLRAAIHGIGTSADTKLLSSYFLMVPPENHPVIKEPIIYADCGVNPAPSALGLRDIAVASVRSFRSLFPTRQPKVAFLSFSTKGSAQHKSLDKVLEAVNITKEAFKDDKNVQIDGELQFDAAVLPAVAAKKAPGSTVAGQANIFIFPDLNAGNICYKVTERLGLFTAIGPLVQGVSKPFNDLSRGCKPQDIYYAAVIALLQSR